MENKVKTISEHLQSAEDMARFCFFYAIRDVANRLCPEKSPGECIARHTILLFHILGFSDSTQWEENELCRMIFDAAERFGSLSFEEFENAMWQHCGNAILLRAEELYPKSRGIYTPPSWNCGCLKSDPPSPENPELCRFHIYNTVSPRSIFTDPEYLVLCFRLLMKENRLHYNSSTLITSTWLNDHPRWLEFFPAEFHQSLTPRNPDKAPGMTVGSWGFLYNARGCANMKYIRSIRQTGELPFLPRTGSCSFDAMARHLDILSKRKQEK